MDGKEAIIAKIIQEANATSAQIIETSENALNEAISSAQAEAEEKASTRYAIIQQECDVIVSRALTLARLEGRKNALAKKQELLKSVYEKAKEKLLASVDEYKKFYAKVVSLYADDGDVVSVGKADEKILDEKWLATVKGALTFSKETHDGRGVILYGRQADKNLTVDALLNKAKELTESEVAKILFGE